MTEQESCAWIAAALARLDGIQPPWLDATGDNQEHAEEKER